MFGERLGWRKRGGGAAATVVIHKSKASQQRLANEQLVKAVKLVTARTKKRLHQLAKREKKLAKNMLAIKHKLEAPPSARVSKQLAVEVAAVSKGASRKPSKKTTQAITDLRDVQRHARLFDERAKLLTNPDVSADRRIQLLQSMETSLRDQESAQTRLGRLLTDPKVWIGIGLLSLTAYGLYRAPEIFQGFGSAAERAGRAAERVGNSAAELATSIGCAAAFVAPLAGGIVGAVVAVPGLAYCAYHKYKGHNQT
jgi:hypothetical protein